MEVQCTKCGNFQRTKSPLGMCRCSQCKAHIYFDRDRWNEYNREWRRRNKTKSLESQAKYREKNREVLRQKSLDHYRKNRTGYLSRRRQKHRELKIKLVNRFGGACSICGYSKNYAALCFHHTDPSIKESSWKFQTMEEMSDEELKTIILLCDNCHKELHNPNLEVS